MLNYLRQSFKRKKARRITAKYPTITKEFHLEKDGVIKFAVWQNPLYKYCDEITQSNIDFFRQYIKAGDVTIDIGANVGDTTVPMAVAAGATGTTYAFDPNPFVFDVLKRNAELNKEKTNIVPVNCAIAAQAEAFYFISSEASFANGGISTTKESKHGKFVHNEKVKGVNLAQFLQDQAPQSKVSLVKIDTEGYDKEIIKSISEFIAEQRPILIAESFGKNTAEEKKELFNVIKVHGYSIFYFEDFITGAKTTPVNNPEEMLKWPHTINILAKPN